MASAKKATIFLVATAVVSAAIGIGVSVASGGSSGGPPAPKPSNATIKPGYSILDKCEGFSVSNLSEATLYARMAGAKIPMGLEGAKLGANLDAALFGGQCMSLSAEKLTKLMQTAGLFVVEMVRAFLEGTVAAGRLTVNAGESEYAQFLGMLGTLGFNTKQYPDVLFMADASHNRPGYAIAGACGLLQVLDETAAIRYAKSVGVMSPPNLGEAEIGRLWAFDLWGPGCGAFTFAALVERFANLPFLWKMLRAVLQGAVEARVQINDKIVTKAIADSMLTDLQIKLIGEGYPVSQMTPATV